MTEFALILFPLLILIGGIIYFGIGLNFWLNMNRVANQGARQAVVNNWPPQCLRDDTCNSTNNGSTCSSVNGTSSPFNTKARLQDLLRCQTPAGSTVTVCFPGQTQATNAGIGDPVKIQITRPYTFWFVHRVGITLKATATMRLEQVPQASLTTGAAVGAC
jgi:hypothetical protein